MDANLMPNLMHPANRYFVQALFSTGMAAARLPSLSQ